MGSQESDLMMRTLMDLRQSVGRLEAQMNSIDKTLREFKDDVKDDIDTLEQRVIVLEASRNKVLGIAAAVAVAMPVGIKVIEKAIGA